MLAMSTAHVDKAQLNIVPVSMPLWGWQDFECLVTSCLLFLTHVSMGSISDICRLVKLEPLFPADTVSVCSLIRIIRDVWALHPGIVLLAVGGQYMCALMSTRVSKQLCEFVFARRWGLGLDWNDNREEFKWEKKGINNVCKEDGKGFSAIVILPFCHSASLSLYLSITNLWLFLISITWLSFFSFNNVCFSFLFQFISVLLLFFPFFLFWGHNLFIIITTNELMRNLDTSFLSWDVLIQTHNPYSYLNDQPHIQRDNKMYLHSGF